MKLKRLDNTFVAFLLLQWWFILGTFQSMSITNNNNKNKNTPLIVTAFMRSTTTTRTPTHALRTTRTIHGTRVTTLPTLSTVSTKLQMVITDEEEEMLQTKFGGYTVKQRLREEIESPFRTVRLVFFGSSTVSALVALYFSVTNVIKVNMGYYNTIGGTGAGVGALLQEQAANANTAAATILQDSLESCAINIIAVLVCGALTYRDYMAGQSNLARIAKGGALAKLQVMTPPSPLPSPLTTDTATTATATPTVAGTKRSIVTLKDYRRSARVLIAVGGMDYITTLARSLNSDHQKEQQSGNNNNLPQLLEDVDLILIPVLLESVNRVGDTEKCWMNTVPMTVEEERTFDITRSSNIVVFPRNNAAWFEYLESEIVTAQKQGFDVMEKGFTIFVKKNGRILRRATGQPQWSGMVGTMEVMDGSRFGMPGDTEKYGGG